jgi:hypothetical protein
MIKTPASVWITFAETPRNTRQNHRRTDEIIYGKARGLLTVVRSLVGCLLNFAPSRLGVRRPRPHYRCAPNRNRTVYYELTWNLIAQRPVSTRDSAKQPDLFEEVTHSPYQSGGQWPRFANQQKKDPVGPARVPTGSSGKERTVSQAAPDSPSLVATGKGGVRRCAAYCSPWWCETCKFPVTGSRSPNPGDNLAVLQTSLTASGDDSLTTAGERGEALATRRRR